MNEAAPESGAGIVATTQRLVLRRFTVADAPALYRIYQDPEVMRFMGPPPASLEEETANLQAHVQKYYERLGFGLWAVILKETGELIGRCGLLRSEIADRAETEISYLLERRQWGRGLAAEAAAAVLAYAFGALGLPRVVAVIDPRNDASRRVAERIGMCYEAEVPYKEFGIVHLYAATPTA